MIGQLVVGLLHHYGSHILTGLILHERPSMAHFEGAVRSALELLPHIKVMC